MLSIETRNGLREDEEAFRRIAILLHSLPERTHRVLLGQLSGDDKQKVNAELATLGDVDVMEQFRALSLMRDELQAETVVVEKVESEIQDEILIGRARLSKKPAANTRRATLPIHVVPEDPPAAQEPGSDPATDDPFAYLNHYEAAHVAEVLSRQSPLTIAAVLGTLSTHDAASLLPQLDESVRAETLVCLSKFQELAPEESNKLAAGLHRELESSAQRSAQMTPQSFQAYASQFRPTEVANGSTVGSPAPGSRSATAEDQAREVDRLLQQLNAKDLCKALGLVTTEQAFLVLCGLPHESAERVLALLPRRKARKVRADMRCLGTLHLSDIDDAKLAVARVALRMTQV